MTTTTQFYKTATHSATQALLVAMTKPIKPLFSMPVAKR